MEREGFYRSVRRAYKSLGREIECTQAVLGGHWGRYNNPTCEDLPDGSIAIGPAGELIFADGSYCEPEKQQESSDSCEAVDENAPLDVKVAKKLLQVYNSAQKRGLEFNLTHTSVRNMLLAKKCFYTGITLTRMDGEPKPTDRTIDRKDPSKGYILGNVVACSHIANQFKNKIERQFDGLLSRKQTVKVVQKMFED